jgi:NAD(P)H-hydrate epimerase
MSAIDKKAIEEYGIPAAQLMERAGEAVAGQAVKFSKDKNAAIFCGYGNNGGDGFVAARHLADRGYAVKLLLLGEPRRLSPENAANLDRLLGLGIEAVKVTDKNDLEKTFDEIGQPGVIIDAIFGIGLKGVLDDFYVKIIKHINKIGAPVISADIPSGLDADTGRPLPEAIKALRTVTFGLPKTGFNNPDSAVYTGKVIVAGIGFPKELLT